MLFNSLHYIYFFVFVVLIYYLIPWRGKNLFLLGCSYYFYAAWNANYVFLIIASTLVDYFLAMEIERSKKERYRKYLFSISIIFNLSILFFFKYFNFFDENLFSISGVRVLSSPMELLIPVGISFYTFQTIIYCSDVYNRKVTAERNIVRFALHVCFFPQLVAGPIERAKDLIPQFIKEHRFSHEALVSGLRLILWGYFKKIVVSNNIHPLKLMIFEMETSSWSDAFGNLPRVILFLYLMVFYMYCDFSGYCDVAVGSARILGFKLRKNFKEPFLSTSFFEFIGKWHITLVWFFRAFLYENLLRKIKFKYLSIVLVFLISGLWHGAAWSYVIWGGLLGVLLIINSILMKKVKWKLPNNFLVSFMKGSFVFFVFAFVGIFSVSGNTERSLEIVGAIISSLTIGNIVSDLVRMASTGSYFEMFNMSFSRWMTCLGATTIVFGIEILQVKYGVSRFLKEQKIWVRWILYYCIIITILFFGDFRGIEYEYYRI